MKNPSDPSLIGSLISCMALLPGSLSRIQHNSQKLIATNTTEMTSEVNAIKFEVVFEIINANNMISKNGIPHIDILIGSILSP